HRSTYSRSTIRRASTSIAGTQQSASIARLAAGPGPRGVTSPPTAVKSNASRTDSDMNARAMTMARLRMKASCVRRGGQGLSSASTDALRFGLGLEAIFDMWEGYLVPSPGTPGEG